MIRISSNGNKIFDTSLFRVEKLRDGAYAYVNHDEQLALASFGNPEAVTEFPNTYLYNEFALKGARVRYEELAIKVRGLKIL